MSTSRTREKADGELFKSTGIDDNATSTAVTIDANENVGVGTASPSARFEVEDNGSATGNVIMKVTQDDQSSHYGMSVGNDSYSTVDSDGFVVYQMNNGHTYLYNGGVDEGPNIGMPVAGGITFGTDTAAANTLDDYEEGVFSPVVRGSTSSGSFSTSGGHGGRYTKIGDVCTLNFVIQGTLSGATGSYSQFNLPFVAKAGTSVTVKFSYVDTPNLNHVDFSCYVGHGVTLGYFIIKTANTSTPVYPAPSSFMPAAVQMYGTATYTVA